MKVRRFILILLFGNLCIGCGQKTKTESGKSEVKEVTLVDAVDDLPPPPPNFTSNFKNLQDWLFSICEDAEPKKAIANYNVGIIESTEDRVIFLVGLNKYDKRT